MGRERNIEIEFDVWVVGSSIKLLVAKREDVFEFVGLAPDLRHTASP